MTENEMGEAQSIYNRELLLKNYLALREQEDVIAKKVDAAKSALQKALGDETECHLLGLKVIYRYNQELDTVRIQAEQPKAYYDCLKEPTLDPGKFRKSYPELADKYSKDSKTRPLKVIV